MMKNGLILWWKIGYLSFKQKYVNGEKYELRNPGGRCYFF